MNGTTLPTTRPVPPVVIAEDDADDDVIPGPPSGQQRIRLQNGSNSRSRSSSKQLDVSLTGHIKGDGILACLKDLQLPPEEFAAGCNLLQAAARGDLSFLQDCLKKRKTHVNFRDYDRRTALHVAASEGHLDICRYLVDVKHAKMHRSDRWGGSPLDDARRHEHTEVERYLRSKGATTGSLHPATNLITAAANGDLDEVRMIIAGVRKNKKESTINEGDYDQRTALHLAAGEGHAWIVRYLLEKGANVNAEDRWKGRPLDDAIRHDRRECIEILEQHGGTPGTKEETTMSSSSSSQEKSSKASVFADDPTMHVEFDELDMIERIGAGAFGEIYKCRWRGTLVAAKIVKSAKIRKEWLAKHAMNQMSSNELEAEKLLDEAAAQGAEVDEDHHDLALADFRQEIAVLKSLRHPNICLLLAYSTTEDYEVLVSELMKCNLLDVIKANLIHGTRMKHRTMIVYAQQLAQGMNYLHTCKPPIIHRDLKPANLLIDASGVLKVSDFGLAKIRPDPTATTYRMTGETGSYRFMAPEVYRCEDYDETVDIYSYAMILYTLLSGRPPWADLNGLVAVQMAASENAERPWIPREWDERLSSLLQQCWNEQRTRRPPFSKVLVLLAEYSSDKFKSNPNQVTEGLEPPKVGNETRCSCTIM